MTQTEAVKVLGVLISTFPRDQVPDATLALWRQRLMRFPYEVAVRAVDGLLESRHPVQRGKFPTWDEFVPVLDQVWRQQSQQGSSEPEPMTRTMIADGIEQTGPERKAFGLAALKLVLDVLDSRVSVRSEEYRQRHVALFGVEPGATMNGEGR